jgi:hypothetical protein
LAAAKLRNMKRIEKWLWCTSWAGRRSVGKLYLTEAEAFAKDTKAERVSGSMKAFEEPETAEEIAEAIRRTDTSLFLRVKREEQ